MNLFRQSIGEWVKFSDMHDHANRNKYTLMPLISLHTFFLKKSIKRF